MIFFNLKIDSDYPKRKRPLPSYKVEYFWYSELKTIYTSSIVNVLLLRGKLSLPEGCQVNYPMFRWRLWTQNAGNLSWAASRVACWPPPWPQGGRPGFEARLSGVLVGRCFTRKRTRIRTLFGLQIGVTNSPHTNILQHNINDAIAVLPKLQTGLDVNVRFTGVMELCLSLKRNKRSPGGRLRIHRGFAYIWSPWYQVNQIVIASKQNSSKSWSHRFHDDELFHNHYISHDVRWMYSPACTTGGWWTLRPRR